MIRTGNEYVEAIRARRTQNHRRKVFGGGHTRIRPFNTANTCPEQDPSLARPEWVVGVTVTAVIP